MDALRKCRLCAARKPRRYCPALRDDICPQCCGTERESSVSCPFDCEYLAEARKHEKPREMDPVSVPNQDIRVSEEFLRAHEALLLYLSQSVAVPAVTSEGVVDSDVREALDALVRTYRTRQSGLYYDTRPDNPYARVVYDAVQQSVETLTRRMRESQATPLRDAELLGVLVFLQRLGFSHDNGRRRGRAFIDFLRKFFPAESPAPPPQSPSIVTP